MITISTIFWSAGSAASSLHQFGSWDRPSQSWCIEHTSPFLMKPPLSKKNKRILILGLTFLLASPQNFLRVFFFDAKTLIERSLTFLWGFPSSALLSIKYFKFWSKVSCFKNFYQISEISCYFGPHPRHTGGKMIVV